MDNMDICNDNVLIVKFNTFQCIKFFQEYIQAKYNHSNYSNVYYEIYNMN